MNQPRRAFPWVVLLLLLCLGGGAAAIAFWMVDRHQALAGFGILTAIAMAVFFLSYTAALFLYLRWRDSRRTFQAGGAPAAMSPRPELEGTIQGLVPGRRYRVARSFTDHYGNAFERGEILRFKERHFLPYDGGHTIVFEERPLYLQEETNREIVDHFSDYLVQLGN